MKKNTKVLIMWVEDNNDLEHISMLHSSAGYRVYEKNAYDVRCGENLPYISDLKTAACYLSMHPARTMIQFDLATAKRHSIVTKEELAVFS